MTVLSLCCWPKQERRGPNKTTFYQEFLVNVRPVDKTVQQDKTVCANSWALGLAGVRVPLSPGLWSRTACLIREDMTFLRSSVVRGRHHPSLSSHFSSLPSLRWITFLILSRDKHTTSPSWFWAFCPHIVGSATMSDTNISGHFS